MSRLRIGIDCRLAGSKHAGIGRYIVELVSRVTQHPTIKWVLFYSDQSQPAELFPNGAPVHCELVFTPVKHYTLKEQWVMQNEYTKAKLDLLHVPHFNVPLRYQGPLVITIHDLLWHQQKGSAVTTLPSWQYWPKYLFYRLVTNHAVSQAKVVFVPSETVKKTVTQYYPQVSKKVVVTYEGISRSLQTAAQKFSSARRTKQLLYVGSLYPHKNIELVVSALKHLPPYSLVLVGSRSVFREKVEQQVEQLGLSDRVSFLSAIDDKELSQLYQQSAALIQPSLSEGFGLTGIEAMQFGTPVIASNIPIFREIYQSGAIYFDPRSIKDFCKQVTSLENSSVKNTIIDAQRTIAKQYNWDTLADQTYHVYLDQLEQAHD